MGLKMSNLVPGYLRNFNIEKRVANKIETIEKAGALAPRHPSTVEMFKKIEESHPDVDEKQINKLVVERSKEVKVYTNKMTSERATHDVMDKRPKKENEIDRFFGERKYDADFDKYGYTKPDKIKAGNLTLRQFDEMINEYRSNKSTDTIKNLTKRYNLDSTNVHILLEYYKPLYRINKNKEKAPENDALIDNVFPNVTLIKSATESKSA